MRQFSQSGIAPRGAAAWFPGGRQATGSFEEYQQDRARKITIRNTSSL
jgi:hypothetical protein